MIQLNADAREMENHKATFATNLRRKEMDIARLREIIANAEEEKYPSWIIADYNASLNKMENNKNIFLKVNKRWFQ